ncbi:MAG TPA: retroviral-like aspartic protease family protein [Casimicrobiaceae bacterium]
MRITRFALSSLLVAGLTTPGIPAIAANPSACKMVQIAELPVRVAHKKIVVDGAINGQKVGILLDTGATRTMIPHPTAVRLKLPMQKMRDRVFGVGGEVTEVDSALVREFKVGQWSGEGRRLVVAGERELGDDVAVVLGEDFFSQIDLEFDLAHNTVRLFRPKDCDGVSLAYWAPQGASEVEMESIDDRRPRIFLNVKVNATPVRALLDSGAAESTLDTPEAARLGLQDAPAAQSGTLVGFGPKPIAARRTPLQSFAVGDELITDTTIDVASVFSGPFEGTAGMLLGADFLRAHRLLVAHSQRKIYFSYVGGAVFVPAAAANSPGGQASEPGSSGPNSAADYIKRGISWRTKGDLDRAIADFDAALSVDPRSAAALANRASAKVAKADFEQAIADANSAIEIDPKLAAAFVIRGNAERRADPNAAITDYLHAAEIDPKLAAAYNQLAWLLATAEQPAVRDGRRAVESALKACELSEWNNPAFIDTLAAANARAGDFANAVRWQKKAMDDPKRASDDKAVQRLHLYEEGKAWPPD